MKVLIVEDETAAAENLTYLLRKVAPQVNIAGYAESVEQTVRWLSADSADLIFMDIHLSDGSAFSIFDRMEVPAPVVFTTAYDRYALDAFRVDSIDYLLKPIKADDLLRALDKYRRRTPAELEGYLLRLNALTEKPRYADRLLAQDKDRLIPLPVGDICYIYSTDRHTEVVLKNGRHSRIGKPLEQIMSTLDPHRFIRANKQFIIARDAVTGLTVWFDSRLRVDLLTDTPEPVYISKNKAAEFKAWLTAG